MINKIKMFYRTKINPHCLGLYSSFDEARKEKECSYDSNKIAEIVVKKTENFIKNMEGQEVLYLNYSDYRLSLAMLNVIAKEGKIIDLGGAAGLLYHTISRLLLKMNINIKLNWQVVETLAMVRCAKHLANEELLFVSIDDYLNTFNTQYSENSTLLISSTLQYIPDCLRFLEKILEQNLYENIFITRTPMTEESKTVCSIQKSSLLANGPGVLSGYKDETIYYPINLISFDEIIKIVQTSKNYKVVSITDEDGFITAKNVIAKEKGIYIVKK